MKVENLIHLELAKGNPEGRREWRILAISRSAVAWLSLKKTK
jgi:hypothetical protein